MAACHREGLGPSGLPNQPSRLDLLEQIPPHPEPSTVLDRWQLAAVDAVPDALAGDPEQLRDLAWGRASRGRGRVDGRSVGTVRGGRADRAARSSARPCSTGSTNWRPPRRGVSRHPSRSTHCSGRGCGTSTGGSSGGSSSRPSRGSRRERAPVARSSEGGQAGAGRPPRP